MNSVEPSIEDKEYKTAKNLRVANNKYYSNKGRLWHSINSKVKSFGLDKVDFKECKNTDDIYNRTRELLKLKGFDDVIINKLIRNRSKSKYDE